jgi:hypothetical protein
MNRPLAKLLAAALKAEAICSASFVGGGGGAVGEGGGGG